MYSSTVSLTSALDGGGVVNATPQGRSGQMRKISPPTGIRSPDRPARSKSLHRLSYPDPHNASVRHLYARIKSAGVDIRLPEQKWSCLVQKQG